jgi:oxygen-dependent protoporphyrinogen oxidase
VYYPRAIPQYNVGYGRYREAMTEVEAKAPGVFLAGHYRDGVSLSDSIVSGCNVADRVGKHLATQTNALVGDRKVAAQVA